MSRGALWVLAAATLLSLPVLSLGFFNDDLIHRLALSGSFDGYRRSAHSLYDFLQGGRENAALMDAGLLPWFAEPELTARFFRPLSSLLLALDVFLFGEHALPAHLHSLAWFALAVLLVWKIQRALLPERAAVWATLVFAVAGAHVETTSWIAARHVLVSGVFGLAAWYAEILRGKLEQKRYAALGALCLLAGLLASEAVLSAVPFVLGQAWFTGERATKRRLIRIFPTVAGVLVYLALYASAGYGTRNVGAYVSPFDAPGRFALTVVEKLPILASELFTSVPAVLSYAGETAARASWLLGCVAAGLVVTFALRQARTLGPEARHLFWLPVATAAALVPVCGTIIDGRVLLVPMVGSSTLVGLLLSRVVPSSSASPAARVARIAGLALLFFFHFGLSPLVRVAFALNYRDLGRIQAELPGRAKLACARHARLFVINGSDPTIGMYGASAFYRGEGLARPGWHVLSMAQNDLTLERLEKNAFLLSTLGPRQSHFIEEFYRPRHHALRAGDIVRFSTMAITVLEAGADGPTRVRFDLDAELDAPETCFARWVGGAEGHLESFSLPERGAVHVRYEPGPMGM